MCDQLLSDRDAARLLLMLPARLKRMAKRGEVPHVLLPDGEIRFCRRDLDEWVAAHKVPNEKQPALQGELFKE